MSETRVIEAGKQSNRSLQIVVFKLGGEEYGLMIDQIKEVVLTPKITRIPQTPSYVKGVANIRGNVIAIFDLEERFNLVAERDGSHENKFTLVVESDDVKMGLLVREVPNTITVSSGDLDESVGIISDSGFDTQYIKGVIKSKDRLIILFDVFKVVDLETASNVNKKGILSA